MKYQDPSSGTWYQVTDQGAREGNYLESSATALFIYTLAKAINKGYIDNEYIEPTQKAFDGMVKHLPVWKKTAAIQSPTAVLLQDWVEIQKDTVTAHLNIISVNRS